MLINLCFCIGSMSSQRRLISNMITKRFWSKVIRRRKKGQRLKGEWRGVRTMVWGRWRGDERISLIALCSCVHGQVYFCPPFAWHVAFFFWLLFYSYPSKFSELMMTTAIYIRRALSLNYYYYYFFVIAVGIPLWVHKIWYACVYSLKILFN